MWLSSGLFLRRFPPLPVLVFEFSSMAWSPSVVRFCFLPLFLHPFPAVVAVVFPSGLFGFLPSFLARSLSGAVSLSPPPSLCPFWGRLILPSGCFPSTLFVLFLFSYSCYFSSLSCACSFRVSSDSFSSSFSCHPLRLGFLFA